MRTLAALILFILLGAAGADRAPAATGGDFARWLESEVWPRARAAGVSRATFEAGLRGVTPDRSLPGLAGAADAQHQAEFRSPARYFSESNLASLAASGRRLARQWSRVLAELERRTGVPGAIVVAIWGRESAFGSAAVPHDAIRVLATRAFLTPQRELYLSELIAALQILQAGHVTRAAMRSSWAGAMGQPQFLPSKYLSHGVDGDGDGRVDIWSSVPDTLASIAGYLAGHGWRAGRPWGIEASVPASVSCALEGPEQGRPVGAWARMGVRTLAGGDPARALGAGTAFLMMPAGRLGPAFLVSENFYVLKAYNESDLYALFIGNLADRIRGGGRIAGTWRTSAGFTRADVRAMQKRLIAMGYDVGGADGLVGFKTRIAIGRWQARNGLPPTCFPDRGLITAIR